jgi:YD repeat-containing protein
LPETTTSVFDGATYILTQHYDSFNRPLGVTYPTGYIAANAYNSYGHLTQVKDSTNTTLWTADSADASGNITQFTLGNGVVTTQTYDANTQRIDTIRAVKGSLVIQDYGFDALGNLTTKEGIAGTLGYGTSGTNVAGPHAITSANGWSYQYDAIGNLTTATKTGESTRTVAYSPFNTPTSITQGSKFSTLVYGPNQDRIKNAALVAAFLFLFFTPPPTRASPPVRSPTVRSTPRPASPRAASSLPSCTASDSNGRVTKYVGGIYEEVTQGGIIQKIHYVGDFALYIQTGGATPMNKQEYLHRDHIVATSNINCQREDFYTGSNWWLDV